MEKNVVVVMRKRLPFGSMIKKGIWGVLWRLVTTTSRNGNGRGAGGERSVWSVCRDSES